VTKIVAKILIVFTTGILKIGAKNERQWSCGDKIQDHADIQGIF
jgi:hypothetical protein